MKSFGLVALWFGFLAPFAYADDAAPNFEGTWKVPDAQALKPAACGTDVKECLRLAWTAEAGIRSPGEDNTKRLTSAVKWHNKACAIAKQKPCANADRVQKSLDAAKALKTDAERNSFWCVDALEGAKRFTASSKTAPSVVLAGCKPALPAKLSRTLSAIAGMPHSAPLLLQGALEDVCPGLKTKPPACASKPDKMSDEQARTAFASILHAATAGEVANHSDQLADYLTR
ncbi:MAG: hypothetical protein JWO36_6774 [Myxococcales bacterium]|nr:hypothetical protein [Myxococcales bacterium]